MTTRLILSEPCEYVEELPRIDHKPQRGYPLQTLCRPHELKSKLLKGAGIISRAAIGAKGDTRSLDYGSRALDAEP